MKVRVLVIAALAAVTLRAARAQEVTPEAPADATPPDTVAPPAEPPPPAVEVAPPPAETGPTATPPPTPPPPPAAATPAFGAEGQLVLSIDLPFMNEGPEFAIVHESSSMNGPSSTRIDIQPSVDYFVAPSFSIGAQLGIDHLSASYDSSTLASGAALAPNNSNGGTTLSVEARVGYGVPIVDTVSVWLRLGLGYTHTSTSYIYTADVTGYSVPLSLSAPFLWQPGGHFFVGAGPAFVTQLVNRSEGASGPKTTDYGIVALIGGTIGGG